LVGFSRWSWRPRGSRRVRAEQDVRAGYGLMPAPVRAHRHRCGCIGDCGSRGGRGYQPSGPFPKTQLSPGICRIDGGYQRTEVPDAGTSGIQFGGSGAGFRRARENGGEKAAANAPATLRQTVTAREMPKIARLRTNQTIALERPIQVRRVRAVVARPHAAARRAASARLVAVPVRLQRPLEGRSARERPRASLDFCSDAVATISPWKREPPACLPEQHE
jgi:hypothetical protein